MARRTGAQPGQIGKVRFKDITTKGVPEGKVLASDGTGGIRAADPSEVVGATQLDELADVGTADETVVGNLLAADGSKFDAKTPDAAGLVDKASAQTISGQKTFTQPVILDRIDPISGDVVAIPHRLSIQNAENIDEAATLAQALAASAVITVGHPAGLRTPDFTNLTDAVESLTDRGGGIILILDNNEYEVLDIDGRDRDLRNVTIVGQPGAEPAHMPFIHLQAPLDTVEQSSSSGGSPVPTESTQWHIVGCRLSRKALELEPSGPDVHFGLLIEECAFTNQDPFGIAVGGDEGAIEISNSDANIIIKNCYVEADFRLNSGAWMVLADSNTVKIRFSRLRPNSTSESSPASIQVLKLTNGDAEIFKDGTITAVTDVSSSLSELRVDPQIPSLKIFNLNVDAGVSAGAEARINTGLRLTAFDADLAASPSKEAELVVSSLITIDGSSTGVNGLDTGSLVLDTFYHVYLIGDSSGANAPAGLFSLSATAPALPAGYDVFRRLSAMLTDGSAGFIPAYNKDGFTRFITSTTADLLFTTGDPGTAMVAFDISALVPPTSTRVYLGLYGRCETIIEGLIHAGNPDTAPPGPSSGGQFVLRAGGSTGSGHPDQNFEHLFLDTDAGQVITMRRAGTGFNAFEAYVAGYMETV